MTPGDITMMLNETSGLRVQVTSPSLGGASVRVQGLRGRYTQILSDGLPLYGGQTGGLGLLQIPPMDLGGVEVIKGVASALYGGSALGGVVNLQVPPPRCRANSGIAAERHLARRNGCGRIRGVPMPLGGALGSVELNLTAFASVILDPMGVRDAMTAVPRMELVNLDGDTRTVGVSC